MKNILNQKPEIDLNARLKFSLDFVSEKDLTSKKVLDIGCGFGWFELFALKKNVKEITGIEISETDLIAARTIKDKRAKFEVSGALELPFKNNYFDTVVAWEVIEHIPKGTEEKMYKEINRVLKKSGVFYLSTPYDSIISKFSDPAWWLIGHRHYSEQELKMLGKKNKLELLEIFKKGRIWNLLNTLNLYFSKWIFRRNRFYEALMNKKELQEYARDDGYMGIFVKYKKLNEI